MVYYPVKRDVFYNTATGFRIRGGKLCNVQCRPNAVYTLKHEFRLNVVRKFSLCKHAASSSQRISG